MIITFEYKIKGLTDLKHFTLTPEEYFDELEPNENYVDDGVTTYIDTVDYILDKDQEIQLSEIEYFIEKISGGTKIDTTVKTVYFADGESKLIHRKDEVGYELIIQSFRVAENGLVITRIQRSNPDEDWHISGSLGLNYKGQEDEKWYSLVQGEYLKNPLVNN